LHVHCICLLVDSVLLSQNLTFTGKRTREGEEEEESEEEAEEEEDPREEESEEEEESDEAEMGKKTSSKPSGGDGVESVRKTMAKMKISNKRSSIRSLPPYWYEDDDGDKIVTAEQRLPEDTGNVEALIVPGGKQVHVKCFVSEDYLDTDEFAEECPMQQRRAQLQVNAREKAVRKYKEDSNHESICDEFWIDLPFPCEERFCTKLDDDGFYINYKHNTTLVMVLVGSEKAREKKKTPKKYGTKKFAAEGDGAAAAADDDFGGMDDDT